MEELRIRDARPSDEPALLELHRALHVGHRRAVLPEGERPLHAFRNFDRVLSEDLRAMLHRDRSIVLVADQDGELRGYITGQVVLDPQRALGPRGVVGDWLVVPHARGQGTGRALMDALLDRFRRRGCGLVESGTLARNTAARALHEHLGFVETEVRYRKKL